MDKTLEKFGIYDFMGIWGPGALTVTYYFITLRLIFNSMITVHDTTNYFLTQKQLLIILYTAVSYFLGVVFHEVGKLLCDSIEIFQTEKFIIRIKKCNNIEKKKWFTPFKNIKYEVCTAFNQFGLQRIFNNLENIGFEKAISTLKYNNEIRTNRIDTYHSVYALSRSLCICFICNILLLFLEAIAFKVKLNLWFVIADILFAALFYIRTYRYFHSWVKNVYLQYCKIAEI